MLFFFRTRSCPVLPFGDSGHKLIIIGYARFGEVLGMEREEIAELASIFLNEKVLLTLL